MRLQQASHPSRVLMVVLHGHTNPVKSGAAIPVTFPLTALLRAAQGAGQCEVLVTDRTLQEASSDMQVLLRVSVSRSSHSPAADHSASSAGSGPSPLQVLLVDFAGKAVPISAKEAHASSNAVHTTKPSLPLLRRVCEYSESQRDVEAAVGGRNLVLLDEGLMTEMVGAVMGYVELLGVAYVTVVSTYTRPLTCDCVILLALTAHWPTPCSIQCWYVRVV